MSIIWVLYVFDNIYLPFLDTEKILKKVISFKNNMIYVNNIPRGYTSRRTNII